MTLLELRPKAGMPLKDQLFEAGVEFPCGGETACGGCKIRVVAGDVAVTPMMREALTGDELAAGWRLACGAESRGPVTVEVEQWSPRILTDERRVPLESRAGFGVVVDVGTTTLVAQLVDLRTGDVLGVETRVNPQARYGADVMTRIQHAIESPGELTALIRRAVGGMIERLTAGRAVEEVVLAGNTAMHHLFCGLSVEPLSRVPFDSPELGGRSFGAAELEWVLEVRGGVNFLPCLGGFVGSDLLAGVVATDLDEQETAHALFDIGTNGEIVVGSRNGMLCASTAAGPAFEGGRISRGMRAAQGAIDRVDAGMNCHVIGGGPARGLCGSGLVDAVAAAAGKGLMLRSGRLADGAKTVPLTDTVSLTQGDIRELQLAKGAMAAGLQILVNWNQVHSRVSRLWLAGAFGNCIRPASARAIGLLPDNVVLEPVGNAALRGTRVLLLTPSQRAERLRRICGRMQHVELAADPGFQDIFAESMALRPYSLA